MGSMNETEYLQLAGHITEKLDNTAEYEDWLTIQDYIDELQSNLTKEQLAYMNLKKTFDEQYNENQKLKSQLKQRDEVIVEAIKAINESEEFQILEAMALNIDQAILMKVLSILYKYKGDSNE